MLKLQDRASCRLLHTIGHCSVRKLGVSNIRLEVKLLVRSLLVLLELSSEIRCFR